MPEVWRGASVTCQDLRRNSKSKAGAKLTACCKLLFFLYAVCMRVVQGSCLPDVIMQSTQWWCESQGGTEIIFAQQFTLFEVAAILTGIHRQYVAPHGQPRLSWPLLVSAWLVFQWLACLAAGIAGCTARMLTGGQCAEPESDRIPSHSAS